MHPKHYLKQFHPKYNKKVPKNWDTVGGLWEQHADWMQNPACPTMNGFRTKSYNNGTGLVLERNPYYYAVMPNGDQLPYLDAINMQHRPGRPGRQTEACSRARSTSVSASSPSSTSPTSRL